jgi:hypothetical protein
LTSFKLTDMKIPVIKGVIERRILVNYTVDPEVIAKIIPPPFRLKLYRGRAIAGICLIRLKEVRPAGLPAILGISSENGAHRIAVEWTENGVTREGVFVPRRDTSSMLNQMAGGCIFPGLHHPAHFDVREKGNHYHVSFKSKDDTTVSVTGSVSDEFESGSIFQTLENSSDFFEAGAVGFSPNADQFEGLELRTNSWKVQPLKVEAVHSAFFENTEIFPSGSVKFDHALLMKNIEHEWHTQEKINECI